MESYLEKPQTIGLLLDHAISSFRALWRSLLPLTTCYALLLFAPNILLTYTPIHLSSWLHKYNLVYLGINTYFVLVFASAILYRFFSASNQRMISNSEAFSIALRKSIYATLTVIALCAIAYGVYWGIDQVLSYRIMMQIDLPSLGTHAFNVIALLVSSVVLMYFIPSFGLVVTKNYGPFKALFVSVQWMWGRLNRSMMTMLVAKCIYFTFATSFFIILFILSSIIALEEKLHLYHLVVQTFVAALAMGYVFSVYNMLLIDLEIRHHLKKYIPKILRNA